MNMALIIVILGVVVLTISVVLNVYLCTIITRASRVIRVHNKADEIKTRCLTQVLGFKEMLVYVKMVDVATQVVRENGIEDVDNIDFGFVHKKVEQGIDEVFEEVHNLMEESN